MGNKRQNKRFIKRCEIEFVLNGITYRGISSNFSLNGLFIRTNYPIFADTIFDVVVFLPNGLTSKLKVKPIRAFKKLTGEVMGNPTKTFKSGMGVEIIEKDANYIHFMGTLHTSPNNQGLYSYLQRLRNSIPEKRQHVPEKRQHKRFKVDLVKIDGKMVLAKSVDIVNISTGGILLKTDRRLNIGSKYTLKMRCDGDILTIQGITIWSRLSESLKDSRGNVIPIYSSGLKFTDISDYKISEIIKFIEIHKLHITKQVNIYMPDDLRLYVRVPIEASEKAIILCHEGCKVKELSLNGILVESNNPVEIGKKIPMEVVFTENKSIIFQGRIVSCTLIENDTDQERFNIGIEFFGMSRKDNETLKAFIQLLDTIHKSPS